MAWTPEAKPSGTWDTETKPGRFLLKEDRAFLLLEDGQRIELENATRWTGEAKPSGSWAVELKPT